MFIRSVPLLFFVFIAYNLIVVLGGGNKPSLVLEYKLIHVPMVSGTWIITTGDTLILAILVLLFLELLKATFSSTKTLFDHAFSMLVFVICLVEFLLLPPAHTSIFFFIVVGSLIDVVAGYTIGIKLARRDITIGSN
ncbi:MAG: hypothetical protein TECD_01166 [Hyphomicrobiaceae bacterium hypho_1]